jgi:hypothetical protein
VNWEAIGALSELIGAFSVFLTLLYLAKQIKDNSKLLTTSVYQTAMDGYNEMASIFLENSELTMGLLIDDSSELSSPELSSSDSYRLNIVLRVYMNQGLKLFRLYEAGVFPERDWETRAGEIKQIINATDFGREFARNNHVFDDMWINLEGIEVSQTSTFN